MSTFCESALPASFFITRLTPTGRGAVGTILLEGENVFSIFCQFFRFPNGQSWAERFPTQGPPDESLSGSPRLTEPSSTETVPFDQPFFGHFFLSPTTYEEVVVHRPLVDSLEIHTHGGDQIMANITAQFVQCGGTLRDDIEENMPLPNLKKDLLHSTIASALLPLAKTERTLKILLRQAQNVAFRDFDDAWAQLPASRQEPFRLLKHDLLQGKDYPTSWAKSEAKRIFQNEKTLPEQSTTATNNQIVKERLDVILERKTVGAHLTQPFHVLILGPSNAGKSSLLNAFVGFHRMIVHQSAGTTRDLVSVETVMAGWPILLTDSAGLRSTDLQLERAGIQKSLQQIQYSDLILLVFDITAPGASPLNDFLTLAKAARFFQKRQTAKILIVLNKCEKPLDCHNLFWREFDTSIAENSEGLQILENLKKRSSRISVQTGMGLDALQEKIVRTLVPHEPHADDFIPLQDREVHFLEQWKRDFCNID